MIRLRVGEFSDNELWAKVDHDTALAAFRLSAREILDRGHGFRRPSLFGGLREDWTLPAIKALEATKAKEFFEDHFRPCGVEEDAFFTGYYEPCVAGALDKDETHTVPLYRQPAGPEAALSRREIEQGALAGRGLELCWLQSWTDAYFIHVQGSARIELKEGGLLRLSFAGKNGQPYQSIGRILLDRGVGTAESMSMPFLRSYMAEDGLRARKLMWENPSFIYFRSVELENPVLGGIGAGKVQLMPKVSLAVDCGFWAYGTPMLVETTSPLDGRAIERLMVAQDTGSAIKGLGRGDIYFGSGAQAEALAGRMKQKGRMTALLPKAVAEKLA